MKVNATIHACIYTCTCIANYKNLFLELALGHVVIIVHIQCRKHKIKLCTACVHSEQTRCAHVVLILYTCCTYTACIHVVLILYTCCTVPGCSLSSESWHPRGQ